MISSVNKMSTKFKIEADDNWLNNIILNQLYIKWTKYLIKKSLITLKK